MTGTPAMRPRGAGSAAVAALVLVGLAAIATPPSHAGPGSRPEPVRDLGCAARTMASDGWCIASSPARLDRRGALWLTGTAAVTVVLMRNDEAISAAFRRSREHPLYEAVLDVGDAIEPAGNMARNTKWYAATLLAGYAIGNRPLTVIPAQVVESHLIAGTIVGLGKRLVGRRRPFEGHGPYAFDFNEGSSFPSGHASAAFELATILSHHAGRWPVTVVLYGLATTIALQRVDSGRHWASDVVAPAVAGSWIAHAIVTRHDQLSLVVMPAVSPGGVPGFKLGVGFPVP